jgi:sugar O-acyltransferase (sialic acid O-acetyltransferase NeuD family)
MPPRILCFGAGGHAAVVVDLIQILEAQGEGVLLGLLAEPGAAADVLGVPILGSDAALGSIISSLDATHFVVAVGSVQGGGSLRPRLFARAEAAGLIPFVAIHPKAIVSPHTEIGPGTVIMAGAVLQARVLIGRNVIVNTRCSLDHDCIVGDHAHLAPGSVLSGGVTLGVASHVGTGATIIHDIRIGDGATVAAGATVVQNCPPGATVVGTPARLLRSKP